MEKYRVSSHHNRIEKVQIKSQTEKQVVLMNGVRESKELVNTAYFDNWEVAYQWKVRQLSKEVDRYEKQLKFAKERYDNFLEENTGDNT